MRIHFYKYQGAGNDFIMIDDRNQTFPVAPELIRNLCDRHFGIGADGLILLQNEESADFRMIYYNADGHEGSMCGNGGRCIVRFADFLGLIETERTMFSAVDGMHRAFVNKETIDLSMNDVSDIEIHPTHVFLNTGSPHHIIFTENLEQIDVHTEGRKIRHGAPYHEKGSNVDFVEILDEQSLKIRTYERGVEDETLACGTGIVAAVIAAFETGKITANEVKVFAMGGQLTVRFVKAVFGLYKNIWLTGPAEFVFESDIEVSI
ncbi:MAG: diaminopimelate epimerase [Weeksellaceae bacterium]